MLIQLEEGEERVNYESYSIKVSNQGGAKIYNYNGKKLAVYRGILCQFAIFIVIQNLLQVWKFGIFYSFCVGMVYYIIFCMPSSHTILSKIERKQFVICFKLCAF